ncbi:solute carrier family 23 member 1-like isoform X1 [Temnothorax curvispinosus]|uniref:Solute carrier family 23 member 1-like isoform X1 n=1 Tax=Temnothorax curvispinosus TaxID=300111 RepID=A0A6J1QBV2_9HYME|nr:solute carrier family 23 member 1-like isoform X1 [Temnothorax curvispinosus]
MLDNGMPMSEVNTDNSTAVPIPKETADDTNRNPEITYGIDDVPPWYLCLFMALQHYLTMIGAIVSIPFILTPALCMAEDDPARSHVISTMIFVTGIVTLIQTTVGCRLPLVQGGTISFLVPTLAILNLPQWECPRPEILEEMSHENRTELWQIRMRELSGAIAVSALFQVIIGFGGIVGYLLKFITPLTIVPTVSLVGLSLFENAADAASQHWGIAAGTIILLTTCSQILVNVPFPFVMYRKGHGLHIIWFELFKLFPVLLTIIVMWIICAILTVTDTLPFGHPARSDSKLRIINDSPWFRVPYPGQWGVPTVTLSGVLGMLAGVLACTVESISYYPTTARMCGAPPPPVHAINRGIGIEGLGTMLAGLWGSGNGTNTFGENVGTIGVTKVGSRRVIQWACFLMILQGVISKFGAVFIIIPEPIVGGIFCVMFGMICAFGLSALQYVNLNSSRNLFILGLSMFFPLVLSKWLIKHQGTIQTGNAVVDSVFTVLLSTTILVGGLLGCLLDNIIPGNARDRGLEAWSKEMELTSDVTDKKTDEASGVEYVRNTFDFPCGMNLLRRWKWTSHVPFLPTYQKL